MDDRVEVAPGIKVGDEAIDELWNITHCNLYRSALEHLLGTSRNQTYPIFKARQWQARLIQFFPSLNSNPIDEIPASNF